MSNDASPDAARHNLEQYQENRNKEGVGEPNFWRIVRKTVTDVGESSSEGVTTSAARLKLIEGIKGMTIEIKHHCYRKSELFEQLRKADSSGPFKIIPEADGSGNTSTHIIRWCEERTGQSTEGRLPEGTTHTSVDLSKFPMELESSSQRHAQTQAPLTQGEDAGIIILPIRKG